MQDIASAKLENTSQRNRRTIRRRSSWIYQLSSISFCMQILPMVFLIFAYFMFATQHSILYVKCEFEPIYKLLSRFYIFSNKNSNKTDQNFDVYILDKKSTTDLVYFHGSRISEKVHEIIANNLAEKTRCNLIIPFYRGYGSSKGRTTEISIFTDLFFLNHLLKKRKNNVYLYGQSLGCASALFYGAKFHPKAPLILENPFYEMLEIVKNFHWTSKLVWFLSTDKWNNFLRIAEVKSPIYMLIGEKDDLIASDSHKNLVKKNKNCKIYKFQNGTHFKMNLEPNYYETVTNIIRNP